MYACVAVFTGGMRAPLPKYETGRAKKDHQDCCKRGPPAGGEAPFVSFFLLHLSLSANQDSREGGARMQPTAQAVVFGRFRRSRGAVPECSFLIPICRYRRSETSGY